ncbi:protein-L-isoaspartate(D-aspartate) O-methyltransferase [Agrobacterium vitis]|uniref:Protein-L-isoaspartate O-methyltransferase n=1 Tax=Agrobacterium vitis TaxID=373 RepID=A0A120DCQ0_AGRVI|nr:protein-L-isoaspartate(D-aspartate) O-methyltransferase [Agrobacterium vitis]MCF1497058.1 protein-L-isoaspartate(D-aspartate) O-methyltransferase [Allorhizobium sp. Av2]KAA3508995.1 protein-L-isoaspartate(D-aspartate) O-methyltransferase [Agrobacterium vitis]KAA3526552.1 protein-L-isoaspartate(D-aspartate) O-methyltransferase [Agrobacterium vitis]MCE6073612.1 protein-L-isoaspartate(D-aspartate) O-methyltransferase [Agrobacterium vitis]MCF1453630.1 protein-L-isoaspartate(D-aspartate) O-methy
MKSAMLEKEGFAALVLRLRSEGISDINLLTAVEQTPRSRFVAHHLAEHAYSRQTIPLECGAFMEGADLAVRLIERLRVKPGQRVMEVGTGSGFMTAVLARLSERVVSVERYKTLVTDAQARLEQLSVRNAIIRHGDGSLGLPGEGTFDRIIATAAFPSMPKVFTEQLVHNGVLLAPLILDENRCVMVRLTRTGSRFEREDLFEVPYLPLTPNVAAFL